MKNTDSLQLQGDALTDAMILAILAARGAVIGNQVNQGSEDTWSLYFANLTVPQSQCCPMPPQHDNQSQAGAEQDNGQVRMVVSGETASQTCLDWPGDSFEKISLRSLRFDYYKNTIYLIISY